MWLTKSRAVLRSMGELLLVPCDILLNVDYADFKRA